MRSFKTFLFLFIFQFLLNERYPQVGAKFIVEHGSLKIEAPVDIKGDYDVALANFGVPLYGADLRGVFTYPASYPTACTNAQYANGFPDTYMLPRIPGYSSIVVLDRGACRFTEKVLNAEHVGADAVLICDNVEETLITMDAGSDMETQSYVNNITVPAALLSKTDCTRVKEFLGQKTVIGVLDWSNALPHPDDRVEWEFWTDSNNGCGDKCSTIMSFIKDFADYGQALEQGGYTRFRPHYLTYHCLPEYIGSDECNAQCLTKGKYCASDPDDDLEKGYTGRDVVLENLRQLCVYQEANASGTPWLWWDYVSHFSSRCKMDQVLFNTQCAEPIITGVGLDLGKVQQCMGQPDGEHAILDFEKEKQVGDGERGDVTINPTVIINERHYRGKLEKTSVLNAICAGFKQDQVPDICINPEVSKNECAEGNAGYVACKANLANGKTMCEEKYRGYECKCPAGSASFMDASGQEGPCEDENECAGTALELSACNCDRCVCINLEPGFQCETIQDSCKHDLHCWHNEEVSACMDQIGTLKALGVKGVDTRHMPPYNCTCPKGWTGDGQLSKGGCSNLNECDTICKGSGMKCKDLEGSYECKCNSGTYDEATDTCINEITSGGGSKGTSAMAVFFIILAIVLVMAAAGYALYKYRLRSYMDAEIRAIMAQYMPLDEKAEDEMNNVVGDDRHHEEAMDTQV
mmetsp:Transcript_19009/g.26326  ORF Transcript_19009/g.26326 Transcript_19009/m.26326 type:complete len:693 (-) Transcript_19009:189-2267(-)